MPISAEDARIVRAWSAGVTSEIEIRFRRTNDRRSAQIESFLEALWMLAPSVRVVVDDENETEPPGIMLRDNLRFQAIPAGHELNPFLELLMAGVDLRSGDPPEDPRGRLQLDWPATVRIYVSPHCPHCPLAVNLIAPLAYESPRITVTIIDGTLFPELAARDGIRSAPTILLDDAFRWTGVPPLDELLQALRERDPTQLSADSLKDMLKDGDAGRLAAMILKCGRVFPGFQHLIDHPEWSVRLGAVVLLEELSESNRELARMHVEPVWQRFASLDPSVKGDVVYVSGLAGPLEWIPKLEALLLENPSEEMREVANEALAAILSREES
jgi:glutaredoxin